MAFDSGGLPGLAWGVLGVIRHEMSPALANHRSATQMKNLLMMCLFIAGSKSHLRSNKEVSDSIVNHGSG